MRTTQASAAKNGHVAVLLINLGTPDAPEPKAIRRYLAEFLSDRRVIEIPPLLWKPILHGLVLRRRPAQAAHAYGAIWTEAGSPLMANTKAQAAALAARLGPGVVVDYAMRYGQPAIGDRIAALKAQGCDRILLAPLYPQYSAATTATALDRAFSALGAMRWQPTVRTLPPHFADRAYIDALKRSIEAQLAALPFTPDALVASYHGMPVRTETLGDPYRAQCLETTRLLSEALGREIVVGFQSRFGAAEWFGPSTEAVLGDLPKGGIKRIAVISPGFSVDCVETLEEIAIRGRESFVQAGGEDFAYLSCLNASAPGLDMLEQLVARDLSGWRDEPRPALPAHAPPSRAMASASERSLSQ